MMTFINEDFLLTGEFSRRLYHGYAKSLPVIDYHCHLSPRDIAENRQFENLTQIWLKGDHYKWRAMRTLGIGEEFITGGAPDHEKFSRWAFTVPFTIRNPLYHWTHLELMRYFGVSELLNSDTGVRIYEAANEKLGTPAYSTRELLRKMNVDVVCTTDEPLDDLTFHRQLADDGFQTAVLPTFRPDRALAADDPVTFKAFRQKLESATSESINDFESYIEALGKRIAFFHESGCRLSDHGLAHIWTPADGYSMKSVFSKLVDGKILSTDELHFFQYRTLFELCRMYHKYGWTQQFHLGALRNNSTRMMRHLGADSGFDSIGDYPQAAALACFLDRLDQEDALSKTILYNLNPADNEVFASMPGNFNDGSVKGKIQFGSAWWFLDQKDGMEKQLNALSNMGLLSCFVGMITDSRSFMSYPRHEYFRRILCNLIGRDVENGELPADEKWLGQVITDICFRNAESYFNFTSIKQSSASHA